MFAVADDELTVDEDVIDPRGILAWSIVTGRTRDDGGIEDDKVSVHARPKYALSIQTVRTRR